MARAIGWREAVETVLREFGRRAASTEDLFRGVTELKKSNLPDTQIKHRIRGALDAMKNEGRAERVGAGLWRVK